MLYPQITYPVVIWGLYIGVAAAAIIITLSRFSTGNTIRALLAEGATDKASAKTADELSLRGLSRRALHGSLLGKLFILANPLDAEIRPKGKRDPYKKPKLDMKIARFYLPKQKEYEALERFPRQSVVKLIVALVILTAFFVLLRQFLPYIVGAVIGAFS